MSGLDFARLNGRRVIRGNVHVGASGPWVADVALDEAPPVALSGPVELVVGDLTLLGTIVPAFSGSFAAQAWYRIVAGAAGWSSLLPSLAYHNDLGIDVSQILGDAAVGAGETLGELGAGVPARVEGVDFVRQEGPASRVFGQVLGAASTWWVDAAGVTQVGAHVAPVADPSLSLELLDYLPEQRVAVFGTETPSTVQIGTTYTDPRRLVAPITVRAFDLELGENFRIRAWVDEVATAGLDERVARALRAIVRETFPRLAYMGLTRYRVVSTVSGRVNLQIVNPETGMPNTTFVRLAPGAPGLTAALTPGAVVLVAFADGNPSLPVVTGFASPGQPGFRPASLSLEAGQLAEFGKGALLVHIGQDATQVEIGDGATLVDLAGGSVTMPIDDEVGRVVRYGDKVEIPVVGGGGGLAVGVLKQRQSTAGTNPIAKVRAL